MMLNISVLTLNAHPEEATPHPRECFAEVHILAEEQKYLRDAPLLSHRQTKGPHSSIKCLKKTWSGSERSD